MYDRLFSPIQIRGLELKNRVVLPAMGTVWRGKRGRSLRGLPPITRPERPAAAA